MRYSSFFAILGMEASDPLIAGRALERRRHGVDRMSCTGVPS